MPFTIDGGRLANQVNVIISSPSQDTFAAFAPRSILIKNVDFEQDRRKIGGTNIGNNYARTGFGSPYVGGLYYVSYGFNLY